MYGFNPIGGYGGGVQMPMPQQVQPPQQVGRWLMVHSYKEVEVAPIPIDGTPSLFMLADKPQFYVVTMQGGQKFISAFEFQEQTNMQPPQQTAVATEQQEQNTGSLEARLALVEQELISLRKAGTNPNESDISANESASTGGGKAQNGRRK